MQEQGRARENEVQVPRRVIDWTENRCRTGEDSHGTEGPMEQKAVERILIIQLAEPIHSGDRTTEQESCGSRRRDMSSSATPKPPFIWQAAEPGNAGNDGDEADVCGCGMDGCHALGRCGGHGPYRTFQQSASQRRLGFPSRPGRCCMRRPGSGQVRIEKAGRKIFSAAGRPGALSA